MAPILSLAVPLGRAWLADRARRPDRLLRLVACGGWLGFSPLPLARGAAARSFSVILAGYVGYAIFSVGMGGLADALAVVRVRAGALYGAAAALGIGRVGGRGVGTGMAGRSPATRAELAGPLIPFAMWLALLPLREPGGRERPGCGPAARRRHTGRRRGSMRHGDKGPPDAGAVQPIPRAHRGLSRGFVSRTCGWTSSWPTGERLALTRVINWRQGNDHIAGPRRHVVRHANRAEGLLCADRAKCAILQILQREQTVLIRYCALPGKRAAPNSNS